MSTKKDSNPIRAAALICVAVTSVFLMYMNHKVIDILASPDWCSKALQAERISAQNFGGLTACNQLLMVQLKSLATNSHIQSGVVAMCLLVLIVIVIAGGRLNLSASKTGINANMGRDQIDPVESAQVVADAAQEQADVIADVPPPPPGPAMPEPPRR